jgi:hypothetical protein
MKKAFGFQAVAIILMLALGVVPAWSEEPPWVSTGAAPSRASGEEIIVDAFILRPAGLAALGVGTVAALVALPFAIITNSGDFVTQRLIVDPFEYTFKRPFGDMGSATDDLSY